VKLIINQQVKSDSVPVSRVWKIGANSVHATDVMDSSIIYDIPYSELEVWDGGSYIDYAAYKAKGEDVAGVFNDDIIAQVTKPKPKTKAEIEKQLNERKKAMPQKKVEGLDALGAYLKGIDDKIADHIGNSIEGQLKELHDEVKKNQKLEVKIDDKSVVLKGLKHKQLQDLIVTATLRLPALMVGMAGTGKTHAAEQVAEALGLKFYAMSVGAQTSKSDIIGYMNANGVYVGTHFRTAYEKGGVFLMDELDAGNANVLIQVNAALSNGQAAFPDKMVKMHKDFIFIATANTYGTGMDRQYVGRNQLDAATLDRFTLIDWDIDEDLEAGFVFGTYGKAWNMAVRAARDYVSEHNIRALITPRATLKGCKLLSANVAPISVIQAVLLNSVPDDKKDAVTQVAQKVFDNHIPDVDGDVLNGVPF
jgi:hypothetical protein